MSNITYLQTDSQAQETYITHWFSVDGQEYGLCVESDGSNKLLDNEGYPIDPCNDHDGVFGLLLAEKARGVTTC